MLPDSGDETWAKISSRRRLALHACPRCCRASTTRSPALSIWGSLREGLLDATVDPEIYLSTIESALPSDGDLAVEAMLIGSRSGAIGALGRYLAAPDDRDRVVRVAEQILEAAAPGSNRQLIATRSLVAVTTDVDLLQRWLSGEARRRAS